MMGVTPGPKSSHGCLGTTLQRIEEVLHFSDCVTEVSPHASLPLHSFMCGQTSFFTHNLTKTFCLFFKLTKFVTETVVGHWNKLSREVVAALSLSEFKECLDDACSQMV